MRIPHFREVNRDNFDEICRLSDTLTPGQQKCVASNTYSIAEAAMYPESAWYRAVYLDDTPIGFVMLELDDPASRSADEPPSMFLWRFMVARDHQRSGYGRQVLDLVVEKCRAEGIALLETSVEMGDESPFGFYIKYGFVDTGKALDCGEQILRLTM